MDGYAVRTGGEEETYRLLEASPDGRRRVEPLAVGEGRPIATGERMPPGADAVVRLEAGRVESGRLRLVHPVRPGQDVMPRGEALRRGTPLVEAGELLRPYHLPALLADGVRTVPVYPLRVAVVPVGSDLRGAPSSGASGTPETIGPMVSELLGFADVRLHAPARDDLGAVRRLVAQEARRADLVITIGGSSIGASDVTKAAVAEVGEVLFEGVRANVLKRGAVARVDRTPVLILPGQVVSAVTCLHEHGLHLVGRLVGRDPRRFETVPLAEELTTNHRMDATYLFRVVAGVAHPLPWGVARTDALLRANAFGVLAHGSAWSAGDLVTVQRLLTT